MSDLMFISSRNPIHRVDPDLLSRLADAQRASVEATFPAAVDLCKTVFDDLKLSVDIPAGVEDLDPRSFADQGFISLRTMFRQHFESVGIVSPIADSHATSAAGRVQMLLGFSRPDRVVGTVAEKVLDIVETFPREAGDLEHGRNPGDVIDPYILLAAQELLYEGVFSKSIEGAVAHKAFMIIEGLMGHLHEDVLGEFRGNVRVPESRGNKNQEILDLSLNPFPGADIVQPPAIPGATIQFHQVKSKTGSAKGGDGNRLGAQLRRLTDYYGGTACYDALIGRTLRGHRSMRGVLREAPNVRVLVGNAAFNALTRSSSGPEILFRVYHMAFARAADIAGYRIEIMVKRIVTAFEERFSQSVNEEFLESLLKEVVSGSEDEQDSLRFSR